jgi:hypothetical protein
MPTANEPSDDEFKKSVGKFRDKMERTDATRATLANEWSLKQPDIRRFVACQDGSTDVAGFMVLKINSGASLKIENICVDSDTGVKKGVAKLLMTIAVNLALRSGFDGKVTLTNQSNGTGDAFYKAMGFAYIDSPYNRKMQLDVKQSDKWKQAGGGPTVNMQGDILTCTQQFIG